MSSTNNTHDENAATDVAENKHVVDSGLLNDNNTNSAHDNSLTFGANTEDQDSDTGPQGGSTYELKENKQTATDQLDRLYESLETLISEITVFTRDLWMYLYHLTWQRTSGHHRSGLQEFDDIQTISSERLLGARRHLEQDTTSALKLGALNYQSNFD
ncbi:hypothetical protein KCU95_g13496, partial [Aureobasidium melanogenum]